MCSTSGTHDLVLALAEPIASGTHGIGYHEAAGGAPGRPSLASWA
jgi:hypothetical protein